MLFDVGRRPARPGDRGRSARAASRKNEFLGHAEASAARRVKQVTKDYVAFPALAGPFFAPVLAGNLTANVVRNLWTNAIIFCGHFPDGADVFTEEQLEGETRGEWYVRQMLGSANIEGSPLFHVMSGNLSHQIEHHLFPDLPSNRYAEIAEGGQCAVRGVRPALHDGLVRPAVRLGAGEDRPAVAAHTARPLPSVHGPGGSTSSARSARSSSSRAVGSASTAPKSSCSAPSR